MKTLLMAAAAATLILTPGLASAQQWRPAASYGNGNPCAQERRAAGNRGTVTGGILGAVAGSAIAGHGARTEGAVLGGVVGAVAGHEIAKNSVRCGAYPRGYRAHSNCRWVRDNGHGFEICRGRDGVWRPARR